MKKIIYFLSISLLIAAGCAERGAQMASDDLPEVDPSRMVTMKYRVEGMTCTGCENTVNFAIEGLHGVQDVTSSFTDMYVRITFDTLLVTEDMIAEAVTGKGYSWMGAMGAEPPADAEHEDGVENVDTK